MEIVTEIEPDDSEFVEVDPTGRYGRYNEVLGKVASKTVYRAFDEYEGIEVAWNQVKLHEFMKSPEDLERLHCEIHLLKTLKHKNIMKFYTSWVDIESRHINFVTEMFTSCTLRQYRMKHKRVNIRAVKHWCKQILEGLLYLHSCDPPVIHRDLKCDNIFINGNQGEVKIGDLGLAAILRKSHAAHCVGTPEFMAPKVYSEEYNELVDIYSFGMCVLEIVTFEYPYSECTHPAQIYKKVTSPDALYRVTDPDVILFVEKCLAAVSDRLSARELLDDPFLQVHDLRPLDYNGSLVNGYSNYCGFGKVNCHPNEFHTNEIHLLGSQDSHDSSENLEVYIEGKLKEDNAIFLRLRIGDKEGRVCNIYFPFDLENDTALSVATEMVSELDITDQDVIKIADLIDGEMSSLVPDWKDETPNFIDTDCCHNCTSNGLLPNYLWSHGLQVLEFSKHGCGAVHGRFEEITYQFDGSEQCIIEASLGGSHESENIHNTDIWGQHNRPKLSSHESGDSCSGAFEQCIESTYVNDDGTIDVNDESTFQVRVSSSARARTVIKDYENDIRQELRWLKAKYEMQLSEPRDHLPLGVAPKYSPNEKLAASSSPISISNEIPPKPFCSRKRPNKCDTSLKTYETTFGLCTPLCFYMRKI